MGAPQLLIRVNHTYLGTWVFLKIIWRVGFGYLQKDNCIFVVEPQLKGTKVPFELPPYCFGAKLIVLKNPDEELLPIAVGNTFSRLSAKYAGYHISESLQAGYGSRQVSVGTKRGSKLASHVFSCLKENPQQKKRNFEN